VAIFDIPIYPSKFSRFTIDNRFGIIYSQVVRINMSKVDEERYSRRKKIGP
jgi:hypothetical protein